MNDDKTPIPPRQNKSDEGGSFNWGFTLLITLIVLVLGFSFFGKGLSPFSSKELTLREFEDVYKKGLVILDDSKNAPLQVLISDGSHQAFITGTMIDPSTDKPTGITSQSIPFVTEFNTLVLTDKLKERLVSVGAQIVPESRDLKLVEAPVADAGASSVSVGTKAEGSALDFLLTKDTKTLSLEQVTAFIGQGAINVSQATPLRLYVSQDKAILTGTVIVREWPKVATKESAPRVNFEAPFNAGFERDRVYDLLNGTADFTTKTDSFLRIMVQLLPILLILIILFVMFRSQVRSAGKSAMNFGKSRAKLQDANRTKKVTFKDVAGVTEAKEEVWEIVDFLREPEKFQALGGKIPKGILMVGPPGTGKTLIARAIAGEADVPFFSISGSDFVEMFVGVGASRVRDMFEQAKKNAPCLIFIDEIDAVGRHRGHGVGGGHDEREQTLNALLVEMDGFEGNESVIVIAATNRPDVLDPALLRPGRFDREVRVSLPDVRGREEILNVHARKVKMAKDIDMSLIARGTAGFSGAKLANLINEAALLAVRCGKSEITQAELEESRDKVGWGKERRSMAISEKEKKVTAYHEAGHAICLIKCENTEPLHKVTIIPRGPSLGSTMWLPSEDKFTGRYSEFLDNIVVAMGGRCAEEIVFGDITSGASGDIQMATSIARSMVCEYGMSKELGLVKYGEESGEVFLARDLGHSRNYSEATAQMIDLEIRRFIDDGYKRAIQILTENRDKLELISEALLEYETLSGTQVKELLETGVMTIPPSADVPPPLPFDDSELPPPVESAGEYKY